jgi:hypothetical protein
VSAHYSSSANCDCGDATSWHPSGFCANHPGHREDPESDDFSEIELDFFRASGAALVDGLSFSARYHSDLPEMILDTLCVFVALGDSVRRSCAFAFDRFATGRASAEPCDKKRRAHQLKADILESFRNSGTQFLSEAVQHEDTCAVCGSARDGPLCYPVFSFWSIFPALVKARVSNKLQVASLWFIPAASAARTAFSRAPSIAGGARPSSRSGPAATLCRPREFSPR